MKQEKFLTLPEVEWDQSSPIYSDVTEKFYQDLSEVEGDLEEETQSLIDLQLMPCSPEYVRPLDSSYCENQLPEDTYELPLEVEQAMDAFNKAVEGIILSWSPQMKRIRVE